MKLSNDERMNSQKRDPLKNIEKPLVAGIMMIIVFVIALIAGGSIFYLGEDIVGGADEWMPDEHSPIGVCGVFMLIFGTSLLIGAVCAIKRVYWGVALAGSLLGIFTIGPYYLGSILSTVAFLLLVMSKDVFNTRGRSDSFGPPTAKNRWH